MADKETPAVEVPKAVQARRVSRYEDYSQFVAVDQIYYDGALAYNPGDPVPASNVKRHGYVEAGLVRRADEE